MIIALYKSTFNYHTIPYYTTNLENLEYSGISLNTDNSGNSRGILRNLGEKIVTNKVVLVRHSNICVKQL